MKFILGLIKWCFFAFCALVVLGGVLSFPEEEDKVFAICLMSFFVICMIVILAFTFAKSIKTERKEHPEYQPFYYVAQEENEPKSFGKTVVDVIKWIFIAIKWVVFALFALVLTNGKRLYLEGKFDVLAVCGIYVVAVLFFAIYNRKKKRREAEEKLAEANPWQYYYVEDTGEFR